MNVLQKIFEKNLKEYLTFPIVAGNLIRRQLENKGIVLTEKQFDKLKAQLQVVGGELTNFDLDLNEEQNQLLGISNNENFEIDISNEKKLDEYIKECVDNVEKIIPIVIKDMTEPMLSSVKKHIPNALSDQRKILKGFEKRLYDKWEKPLELLEAFIGIVVEAGEEFNNEFRSKGDKELYYVLEALTRLHARACQTANEVFVLLKSGFADGALARWRSLHEISVVVSFIKTHGNEVAERYLLHENIESYKAANQYNKYYNQLCIDPISEEEYDSIKTLYDELVNRFGKSYKNNYGWASDDINIDNPKFSDIEKNSKLDHFRPYYKMASHKVHANPKGILFNLGLLNSSQNVLLAGPSDYGFTDPAHGTAISLGQVTTTLLTIKPTIDSLVLSNILLKLIDEIGEEFFRVQTEFEDKITT